MEIIFTPADLSSVCAQQAAPLTQCSQGGYIFVMLTAYLFGGAKRKSYSAINNEQVDNDLETSLKQPDPYESQNKEVKSTGKSKYHPTKCSQFDFTLNPKHYNKYDEVPVEDFDCEQDILNHNFVKRIDNAKKHNYETESIKVEREDEYDFIIVGAGSSGCVMANRLTEEKYKVLLIEAGSEEPDIASVPAFPGLLAGSSIDWKYTAQPDGKTCLAMIGQTCTASCGRVMGGSSTTNYFTYMRGNKRDYDIWAEEGNVGWSYKDVLPYFKKSENNRDKEGNNRFYHGVGGPLTVERFQYNDVNNDILKNAFMEKGLPDTDFNGKNQLGTMITQTTTRNGKRLSTYTAFIEPIRGKRSNLHIKTNSLVTGIIIEPTQKIASGVTYIQDGIVKRAYARKEVIVSAGSYNSAKLLLSSGVGPAKDLKKLNIPVLSDLPVGHNLQDHVSNEAMIIEVSNKTSTLIDVTQIIKETLRYYTTRYSDGVLAQTGILGVVAFIKTKFAKDSTAPDIQFHFDPRNVQQFYSDPTTYLATRVLPFSFYNGINVRAVLVAPESKGLVTLNSTNPIFGAPLIYTRYLSVQRDRNALIAALKFAVKLEETKAFKENGFKFVRRPVKACAGFTWGTDEYFNCIITQYTGTIFHPTGTCRMGPKNDKTAVVDPRLQVYGIKHLRVACNAVMRNVVRGNTNAAAIMIGEKASDLVKEDWQGC